MKIRITSKREGFRRAGRAWPEAATDVDAKDFSKEQLAALREEPMLVVVEAPADEKPKDAK